MFLFVEELGQGGLTGWLAFVNALVHWWCFVLVFLGINYIFFVYNKARHVD